MEKSIRLAFLAVLVSGLSMLMAPQARAWRFDSFGGRAEPMAIDPAGDVIVAGRVFYGGEVFKLSGTTGQVIWRFNASQNLSEHYVSALAVDANGDVFVAFATRRGVTKISGTTGVRIWEKPIGGSIAACQTYINSMAVDGNGNVVTAGTSGCLFNVAKLDGLTGDEKWHYEREGYGKSVAVDPAGDVAAAGIMNKNFGVVKLNGLTGLEVWQREINGAGSATDFAEEANAVAMDSDGSVIAAGATSNIFANPRDFTVAKYTPGGALQWAHALDGGWCVINDHGERVCQSNDQAHAVVVAKDGSIFAAGSMQEDASLLIPGANEHFHVVKISRDGDVVWSKPAEEAPFNGEYTRGRGVTLSVNAFGNVVAGGVHGTRFTLVKFWGRTGGRAWRRQLTSGSDPSGNGNQVLRVAMDAASDVVAAGETLGPDGFDRFTVVKLNRKDGLDYGDAPLPPFPNPDPSLTPVIFIPGIAGSYLKKIDGDQAELWPGGLSTDHHELSLSRNPNLNAEDVIRQIAIPILRDKQVYKPLLDAFRRAGYVEGGVNPTLFVFPYDWRKSNKVNATLLRDKIIEIRQRYPNTKVNIVTHSMGGLLARRYIIDNPDPELHHVDKIITIAAPWLGAPKVLLALETGEFLPFPMDRIVGKSTLKELVKFFPSAHELIPSRAYFTLGGRPFAEEGWDINGDGEGRGLFATQTYEKYDQLYGLLNYRFAESVPAVTGAAFHDREGQDNWQGPELGVRYFHLYGIKPRIDTISQVVAKLKFRCRRLPRPPYIFCLFSNGFDAKVGIGDGTVPILSAIRKGDGQNYNADNAVIVPPFIGEGAEHLKLTQNPDVQLQIFSFLNLPTTSPSEVKSGKIQSATNDAVTQQAYYLRIEGAASAALTDEAGNETHPLNDAADAGVSEATSYLLGADSFLSIMPTDDSYTLTFVTGENPVTIDLTKGTDVETVQAIRYLDLDLPANTKVQLEITPEGVEALRYDSDGDGTFETVITPTASVSGPDAQDTEPPAVAFHESAQPTATVVTLNATDSGAGVRSLFYSLDGSTFEQYVGAISLNPRQTPVIYAFAEDNIANRSSLYTYSLAQPSEDTIPPRLILPSDITVNAYVPQGATVYFTVTATDNATQNPRIACTSTSGSLFPIGNTTVACTATDEAGNSTNGTFKIIVKGAGDQITDVVIFVKGFNLQNGIENSLVVKLQNALAKLNAGNRTFACNHLSAFINEVQAQSGKKISVAQANQMLATAARIRKVLGC